MNSALALAVVGQSMRAKDWVMISHLLWAIHRHPDLDMVIIPLHLVLEIPLLPVLDTMIRHLLVSQTRDIVRALVLALGMRRLPLGEDLVGVWEGIARVLVITLLLDMETSPQATVIRAHLDMETNPRATMTKPRPDMETTHHQDTAGINLPPATAKPPPPTPPTKPHPAQPTAPMINTHPEPPAASADLEATMSTSAAPETPHLETTMTTSAPKAATNPAIPQWER